MSPFKSVSCSLFSFPLAEVLTDSTHGAHSHFDLLTATVTLADGREGCGYTYRGGKGGHASKAMIEHDLAPAIARRNAEQVEGLHDLTQWQVQYAGRSGIASFANSASDIERQPQDLDQQQRPRNLLKVVPTTQQSVKIAAVTK